MDSITESASTEMKTYKEGELIKGKDFIRLESPLVLLSKKTPLLTEAQDVAGAINELFQSGTGAANGSFRAVLDNNAGLLKIIVQEGEKYADYEFAYETFDFSDSITTKTTSGDAVTTTTRKFSKRIITSLTDSSGAVLLLTEYDADSGEILGHTDGSGEVVYTSEWRSEYEITETQSQGASSAAVAWCIARNMEQSESLAQQKKAYRKGIIDYGDNVEELIDDKGQTPFELVTDDDVVNIETATGRKLDMWYTTQDNKTGDIYYINIRTIDSPGEDSSALHNYTYAWEKLLVYDTYDAEGNIISQEKAIRCSTSAIDVPWHCWYYKPTYIAYGYEGFNDICYVEKLVLTNEGVVAFYKTINLSNGIERTGSFGTVFNIGSRDFTTVRTTSEKPF